MKANTNGTIKPTKNGQLVGLQLLGSIVIGNKRPVNMHN